MECSSGGGTLQVMRRAHALGAQVWSKSWLLMMNLRSVRMTDPGSRAQPSFRSPYSPEEGFGLFRIHVGLLAGSKELVRSPLGQA